MKLQAEKISFSYGNKEVLKDVSFTAHDGEFISLLGPNGAGKSTLFKCIIGLSKPGKGCIYIDGSNTSNMNAAELSKYIAYIPQSHAGTFNYSVFEMVLMGTTSQLGRFSTPGAKEKELAINALNTLGILHLKDCGYRTISGGERQLVLIARAIAQKAKILLMDEPSSNLDIGNRIKVMQTAKALTKQGYCVIQITHEAEQAYAYSDKILALMNGQVLKFGSPKEVICSDIISKLYGVKLDVSCINDTQCVITERTNDV